MKTEVLNRKTWKGLIILILGGIAAVIIALFFSYFKLKSGWLLASNIGLSLLISGAAFSLGGLTGFIFGVPSFSETEKKKLKYNDNLLEVSDWLTKIIIGVGLVELKQIPAFLYRISLKFNLGFEDPYNSILVIAILVHFSCVGFLALYFWTRTGITLILHETDETLEGLKALIDGQNSSAISRNKHAFLIGDTPVENRLHEGNIGFEKKVWEELDKRKNIHVPDDLQKNRWGEKNRSNGKVLMCSVTRSTTKGLFNLDIVVYNESGEPLFGQVAFFVHDTFSFPYNVVLVAPEEGIARLTLIAYEAFTIGALCEDDGTTLELDLNEEKNYPEDFYWK